MRPPPEYPASTIRPLLDLDPGRQVVGEAEPSVGPPGLEVVDGIGRGIVVAGETRLEGADFSTGPVTASEGIQDTVVTDDSTRMSASSM